MKSLLLLCAFEFTQTAFGGGGGLSIVAEMNGWTVTLSDADGSDANISKSIGDKQQFHAQISFSHFPDYYLILRRLPRVAKGQKSDFKIVEDDGQGRETIILLRPEYARPILELLLLNSRKEFRSFEPEKLEAELNKNPPVSKGLMPNGNFKFVVAPR